MSQPPGPWVPVHVARRFRRERRLRTVAQVVAVLAGLSAFADLCRWGNRWYMATTYADSPGGDVDGLTRLASAHACLVSALVALVVAAVAATVGWRLRVVRAGRV